MKIITQKDVTGLILTGGAGRRVNKQDKGQLLYKGQSLISHQIKWLSPQVETIIISANRNIEQYSNHGYTVIQDDPTLEVEHLDGKKVEFNGPLYGVVRGLQQCNTPWLFVQTIDTPLLPETLVRQLTDMVQVKDQCLYIKTKEREHYLNMLIHRNRLELLKDFIARGESRVKFFHQENGSRACDLGLTEHCLTNLNALNDYGD